MCMCVCAVSVDVCVRLVRVGLCVRLSGQFMRGSVCVCMPVCV